MSQTSILLTRTVPAGALLVLLFCIAPRTSSAQEMNHSEMHHAAPAAQSPARVKDPAELEADKKFSEFNHRFAGVFVLLVGLLALIEPRIAERYRWVRYLWSVLFFAPGVYLIVWSDPESWPTGNQTLSYVITQNMQVLQHKLFALLLLGLGIVEFIRVRMNLQSAWISAIFPVLAGSGALLLLYHNPAVHAAGMGPAAHQAMQNIEHQHVGFAVVGFGIALSKAISDVGRFRPRLMRNVFSVLMMVLAYLLITYTE